MRRMRRRSSSFAAMGMRTLWYRLVRSRHYLLMDGMNSCAYVPRRTYRRWMGQLYASLEADPKAENSLRFVWTKTKRGEGYGVDYLLLINPDKRMVAMNCTMGLTKDNKGRVLIPNPYVQEIYAAYGLAPDWCGRMAVRFVKPQVGTIATMVLERPKE